MKEFGVEISHMSCHSKSMRVVTKFERKQQRPIISFGTIFFRQKWSHAVIHTSLKDLPEQVIQVRLEIQYTLESAF